MNSTPSLTIASAHVVGWVPGTQVPTPGRTIIGRVVASVEQRRRDRRELKALRSATGVVAAGTGRHHEQLLRHHPGLMFRAA